MTSGLVAVSEACHLHYTRRGAGPTVLLVHGWCCHGGFWEPVARRLAARATVVCMDLRGHGASDARGPYTVGAFARDVCAVVERLRLHRPLLVGHSLGAAAVLEAAVASGDSGQRVVLVDPWVLDYGRLDETARRRLLAPFRRNLPKALGVLAANLAGTGTDPAITERVAAELVRTPAEVALPAFESLLHWHPEQALRKLERPCLVVESESSAAEPMQRYARWTCVDRLASGHFPMLEAPDALAEIIGSALASTGRPS